MGKEEQHTDKLDLLYLLQLLRPHLFSVFGNREGTVNDMRSSRGSSSSMIMLIIQTQFY